MNQRDHAMEWYEKGQELFQLGQYFEAIEAYNEAIRINFHYGDAYLNRGHCYKQLGNTPQAFDNYSKAATLGNDEGIALMRSLQKPREPEERKVGLRERVGDLWEAYRVQATLAALLLALVSSLLSYMAVVNAPYRDGMHSMNHNAVLSALDKVTDVDEMERICERISVTRHKIQNQSIPLPHPRALKIWSRLEVHCQERYSELLRQPATPSGSPPESTSESPQE